MLPATSTATTYELEYHSFELIGKRVKWSWCHKYVKRILKEKIAKGHITSYVKPDHTIEPC